MQAISRVPLRINPDVKEKLVLCDDDLYISEECLLTFGASHLTTYPETTHEFSFSGKPYQWFADREVAHLLNENESITVSSIALPGYYVIGTNLGNVMVVLSEVEVDLLSYHTAPITCFHICHGKLVTCSEDGVICLWPFSYEEGDNVSRLMRRASVYAFREVEKPTKVIHCPGGTVTQVLEVMCLCDTVETLSKQYWEHSWKNWEQTLLAQQEDGTLLLISLITDEVVAHFFGLSGTVEKASIHVMLEYLVVVCIDGAVYVFNMMSRTLERVVNASAAAPLLRTPQFPRRSTVCFEEIDAGMSPIHKLVFFNLKSMETSQCTKAISQSPFILGNTRFSALSLDMTDDFELSELNCSRLLMMINVSRHCEETMGQLANLLESYVSLQSSSLNANMGQFGVDESVSFTLPCDKPIWSFSSNLSTKAALMMLIFLYKRADAALTLRLPNIINLLVDSQDIPGFNRFDIVLLASFALKQNKVARMLLKRVLVKHSDLSVTCNFLMKLLLEKYPLRSYKPSLPRPVGQHISALTVREQKMYVGQVEALSAVLLGYISITSSILRQEHLLPMNLTLTNMLKADPLTFKQTSIYIIGKCLHIWRDLMTYEQQEDLLHSLARIYMKDEEETLQENALRSLLTIGKSDPPYFVRALDALMKRGDTELQYPCALLKIIDQFISKNSLELSSMVNEIVETLLKSLDPHKSTQRKACLTLAGQVFHTLVNLMPMFTVSQEKQRLAAGTLSRVVVLYDLKTASRWKVLEAHSRTVDGVEFNSSGSLLATYSMTDEELKIWKLDSGFFGSILGKSTITLLHHFHLPTLETKESWTNVKVRWKQDNVISLRREDKSLTDLRFN
mmetsp:Transcript_19234/g.35284  ORF Transcript_19234/g.35284 Transcript_19234/m.35284 type:complete len:849 (-) Transcript_19234:1598-4144(-)|eukprot:CAMPEP_0204910904 /NCGR_PEP_ID=MMETSP1397-20131031/9338_1 /ASSEMBLY_ACC=CAM_ASM_000891 /TAXON_ID=49980 /ORGANISM="Climacostomum Climacostomum virens, Strain Stock W-24" /LENGTH=848 /DNA_ID=CAMNT_0052081251 /DNA_START=2166 /DNA_END=4712 /DNA_ORIENTATION=-